MAKWLAHHGVAHSSLGYIAGVTGMQSRRRPHLDLGLLGTTGAPLLYVWTICNSSQELNRVWLGSTGSALNLVQPRYRHGALVEILIPRSLDLVRRHLHVPDNANRSQHPQQHVHPVKFPPHETMPARSHEGMMVVVPAFTPVE